MAKSVCVGLSPLRCRKCFEPMGRFCHHQSWQPRKGQPFYFRYWDKCKKCRSVYHYEIAKVFLKQEDGGGPIPGTIPIGDNDQARKE